MSTQTFEILTERRPLTERLTWFVPTAVSSLTVIALFIRLFNYRETLFGDEFYAWAELKLASGLLDVIPVIHDSIEVSPPLYFLFAWFARQAGSAPELIRVPSLVAGTLLVPAGFLLARRVAGEAVGVVAAALIALSPFAVYYGGEGRPYGLVLLLGALTPLALLWALDGRDRLHWVVFSIACAAAFYTHLTTVFMVGGCLLWALAAHADRWREIAASALGTLVLYLPWAGYVSGKESLVMYGSTWGRGFDWFWTLVTHATLGGPYIPLRLLPGTAFVVAMVACVAIGVATRLRSRPRVSIQSPLVLLAVIAASSAFGLITYSTVTNVNLMMSRNFSPAFAATMVLMAAAVAAARPSRLAAVTSLTLIACFAVGAFKTTEDRFSRPNGKEAARLISTSWRPGMLFFSNDRNRYRPYMGPEIPPTIDHLDQSPTWAAAKATNSPVAFMITTAPHYDLAARRDPVAPAGYRLACHRSWSGYFPVSAWIFEPSGSTQAYPPPCDQSAADVATLDTANARRASILSWANGKRILPQDEPLSPADLVMPAVGLFAFAGFVGWAVRDRRRRI